MKHWKHNGCKPMNQAVTKRLQATAKITAHKKPITDTTQLFSIDDGDVIMVGNQCYKVIGHERETRFGLDEPKLWVKRVIDLETGKKKIMKLSFFESFETMIGTVPVRRFRSPAKEAEILKVVKNHPNFMQGISYKDDKSNIIRILDIIRGPDFYNYIDSFNLGYQEYFQRALPQILKNLVRAFEAIRFLHLNGYRHGDIRNDHLLIENQTGKYMWIDFDYEYETGENPFGLDILGIGNILIYAVGKGFHTKHLIQSGEGIYSRLRNDMVEADYAIIHRSRFVNLIKLFPIIPKPLNDILMHFSRGSGVYYEVVDEVIEDVNRCIYLL